MGPSEVALRATQKNKENNKIYKNTKKTKKYSKIDKMLSCKHLLGKLAKLEPPSCGQAG